MISIGQKEMIVEFLNNEMPGLEWISLFGSVINTTFDNKRSDIDIAFINAGKITNVQRWDIQEKLASRLNFDVDLVDLRQSNDVLSFEILTKGETIYEKKSHDLEMFLDRIYINYIQLNEDRQEIMKMYA